MITLENEHIKASFLPKGAELKSLIKKDSGQQYMWNADPDYWGKTSPVLFPIVGALKNNTYSYKDREYELSRHGFARDKEFQIQQLGNEEVLFTLKSDEQTLKNYPFEFNLGLRYRLNENILSCSYEVHNPGASNLLFSIGGHPAFAVPLSKGENYNDYELEFNADQVLTYYKINDNLIDHKTENITLLNRKLRLQHDLFYDDALVFKSLKSNRISLQGGQNKPGIHFSFEGFPYFGIWSAKDADFVCLEPWCGIADGIDHDQDLDKKEGIITLLPGGNWHRTWKVQPF